MLIYPAIDLRQGRCVRLRQGDPNAETVFSDDPAEMARRWVAAGAKWLHVVNLDGAFQTNHKHSKLPTPKNSMVQRLEDFDSPLQKPELPVNLQALKAIRAAVDVPIQFGGGLRTLDDIELAFSLGVDRVVLGTVAVKNPELVRQAIERWGAEQIAVGIDAKEGKVAIHGWQDVSEVDAVDLAHTMRCYGVKRVIFTDISRDGTLAGVNYVSTSNLGNQTDLKVIASGGVGSMADIRALKRHEYYNIEGVIIGQALYTGKIDLAEAIAVAEGPLVHNSAGILPFRRMEDGSTQVLLLWNCLHEQWQFPRGTVEEGESNLECARREFAIETHLPLAQLHGQVKSILRYEEQVRDYHVERTVVYFLAEVGAGQACLGHENHGEYRWVNMDDAKEMLMDTSPEQLPAWETLSAYLAGR
jgi:phosphoribosylformimino-5-aminoimidazole carboxamide ribotide isomerase